MAATQSTVFAQVLTNFEASLVTTVKPFRDIDVGEPDANAEYFISLKEKKDPVFVRSYFDPNLADHSRLERGEKFILIGQKGTGKTAILRKFEASSIAQGYKTEYVVFRKEIMEETDLLRELSLSPDRIVVDEEQIKKTRFFHHAMKRLILSLVLSKCTPPKSFSDDDPSVFRDILSHIKSTKAADITGRVVDSIMTLLSSASIDISKISKGRVQLDAAKIIKRDNDKLMRSVSSLLKNNNERIRIFLDEMHFAYRDQNTLRSDAALVRDTVLAVQALNESFIRDEIDCTVFMSIRSEFLEHEEISVADVAHGIQSYGQNLVWDSYPYDESHPIFEIMRLRLSESLGADFSRDDMFARYFPETTASEFLDYTWGKPRDIVRFFRTCKSLFLLQGSIERKEYLAALRTYANDSWQDMKSAITAFIPKEALPDLESVLRNIAPSMWDNSVKLSKADIMKMLHPIFRKISKAGVTYSEDNFFRLLYIVGVFYFEYTDNRGRLIFHQYHRANRQPAEEGRVRMHRAVARAFG